MYYYFFTEKNVYLIIKTNCLESFCPAADFRFLVTMFDLKVSKSCFNMIVIFEEMFLQSSYNFAWINNKLKHHIPIYNLVEFLLW